MEKPAPRAWQLSQTSILGTARGNYCPKIQQLLQYPRAYVQAPPSIPSKGASNAFKINQFFLAWKQLLVQQAERVKFK